MLLTHNGARWEAICKRAESPPLQAAGFHWDYRNQVWWTGKPEVARQFALFADERAKRVLNKHDNQLELSRATDSNIIIPAPAGMEYLPFQKAGVAYALTRPNTLIADEMGLGKTVQACGLINADPNIQTVLVVCPASLKINWQRELVRWLTRSMSGDWAEGGKLPDTDIVIANYELIKRCRPSIDRRKWDLVIFDEAHYLKNPDTQRTVASLGRERKRGDTEPPPLPIEARRRLFLTGTPILNRPVELWPIVRIADPEGLGSSYWAFVRRYCGANKSNGFGYDVDGASNLEELQERLRTSIMIRRLKGDVLTELPPKRRQVIALPTPSELKSKIAAELNFYESNTNIIEAARVEAERAQAAGDQASYELATTRLKDAEKVLFERMSEIRHQTGVLMIPYAITYISDVLEDKPKICVFCHHADVCERIAAAFPGSAWMHGGMALPQRQLMVDKFQNNQDCRVIVGTYGTMGVGWTLTAADYWLSVEEDWVPANITQAEDRLHRIGQKNSVLCQHLVFDGSLAARMAKRTVEKQNIIDKALDK